MRPAPDEWTYAIESALRSRPGTKSGAAGELVIRCLEPDHEDKNPSATWSIDKGAGYCHGCNAAWNCKQAAELLGVDLDGGRPFEQSWEIRDASNQLVATHYRIDRPEGGKSFWWSRNGNKGLGGLPAANLPLYGSEHLGEREPGDDRPVFVCEGEKAADAVMAVGLPAVGTVTGAQGTPGAEALGVLQGRHVVCWPDADADPSKGPAHMKRVAGALAGVAGSVRSFYPDGLPEGGDACEWIGQRRSKGKAKITDELLRAVEELPRVGASGQPENEFVCLGEGRYVLKVPEAATEFEVDHLRRERGQCKVELLVRCALPGALTFRDVLAIGDINLSAPRSRQQHAKYLAERSQTGDAIDWTGLMEELAQRVLVAEREGDPPVELRDQQMPASESHFSILGSPLLLRNHPTCLFGDGGHGKSLIALWLLGELQRQHAVNVMLCDWELDLDEHRKRMRGLWGEDEPRIKYMRCSRPLVREADRIRRWIAEHQIGYVLFDSVSYACVGPAESHEAAAGYFQALRSLGQVGSLHIAHRNRSEQGHKKIFGSVFWTNSMRSVWNVAKAEGITGSLTVALHQRKANLSRLNGSIGLELAFSDGISVRRVEVAEVDELAAGLGVRERIIHALRQGFTSREELEEKLPDILPDTLRPTLSRMRRDGKILEFPAPGGGKNYALPSDQEEP